MDNNTQEKLITIARKQREIYNNGIAEGNRQGRQDVFSNSKYIEKTVGGKGVYINDVSELYHKVRIYANTPTEVKICGKNLFDISTDARLTRQADGSYINNKSHSGSTRIPLDLPFGTYTLSYDLSCPVGKNMRITIGLEDGTSVELYKASTGDYIHFEKVITGKIITWYFSATAWEDVGTLLIKNAQIEMNGMATEYEEYECQTIAATPDGTEADSICPIMNFLTDSEITVDYYGSYGMQTEYDRFWDNYQRLGARASYGAMFMEKRWNDAIFKPKYDMITSGEASQMFYMTGVTDLEGILERQGVVIDCSECTNGQYMFGWSNITRVPELNLAKCKNTLNMFAHYAGKSPLKSIRKIISGEATVYASSCFSNCSELEHCIFEGIVTSDINMQWSTKLNLESLVSLINCLKNFYQDDPDNTRTKTITLSSESWALLDTYVYENMPEWSDAKDWVGGWYGWNYA